MPCRCLQRKLRTTVKWKINAQNNEWTYLKNVYCYEKNRRNKQFVL